MNDFSVKRLNHDPKTGCLQAKFLAPTARFRLQASFMPLLPFSLSSTALQKFKALPESFYIKNPFLILIRPDSGFSFFGNPSNIIFYYKVFFRKERISSFSGITQRAPFLVVIMDAAALAKVKSSFKFSCVSPSSPCSNT